MDEYDKESSARRNSSLDLARLGLVTLNEADMSGSMRSAPTRLLEILVFFMANGSIQWIWQFRGASNLILVENYSTAS